MVAKVEGRGPIDPSPPYAFANVNDNANTYTTLTAYTQQLFQETCTTAINKPEKLSKAFWEVISDSVEVTRQK